MLFDSFRRGRLKQIHPCALYSDIVTRRRDLLRSALILGACPLLPNPLKGQSTSPDLAILNYALTLENLVAAFYVQGMAQFSSIDFGNSSFIRNFGNTISGDVYAYLSLIRDHEQQHASTLKSLISSNGGTPAKACTYNFNCKSADDFVTLAASLENTEVAAYNGILYQIQDLSIRMQAASIASAEGRHSAYLNLLTGGSPCPASFDTASSSTTVATTLAQYVTMC